MTIVHLKLGKITKRSDGRYQAGYRDLDGNRKFITCNSEEEVLERFQALQPAQECEAEAGKKRGRPKADGEAQTAAWSALAQAAPAEDVIPLADYMLNWLEKFKKGKIRPSSYERYQFCLQLLCKDELAQMDVRSIRLEHIQEYVNRLEDMSASTIKKQKPLLSQVLEHAVLTELLQRNPALRIVRRFNLDASYGLESQAQRSRPCKFHTHFRASFCGSSFFYRSFAFVRN